MAMASYLLVGGDFICQLKDFRSFNELHLYFK
jgi:hypothetical protein